MATVATTEIILRYKCDEHDETEYEQPLCDVPDVGTLICPECGDDMTLLPEVRIETTAIMLSMTEIAEVLGK